jgi:biotin carboxyl carrier protein
MKTGVFTVKHGDLPHRVTVTPSGDVRVDEGSELRVSQAGPASYLVTEGGRTRQVFVIGSGERRQVFADGEVYEFLVGDEAAGRSRAARSSSELLSAPMPARVTAIVVESGQAVRKGDVLLKLEAMKMELAVRSPRDGVVSRIACAVGDLVQPGVGLLEVS